MTKYMGYYYAQQSEHDLRVLRSKKILRLTKLQSQYASYLNMQERKQLNQQIGWIDAELACRKDQLELGL